MPVALVACAMLIVSCTSGDPTVRGVVIDVQGDLVVIDRFTILTESGEQIELEPAPDARFHDGAPLSHLNEHLRNGELIEVTYQVLADGTRAALTVEDVDG